MIGILGGGQLGRMLGLAARAMGYRVGRWIRTRTARPPASPTRSCVAAYDDVEAARRLAGESDVVTYELEHVGLEAAAAAGEVAPLRPGLAALRATQDRLAERRFIREIGERAAPRREVRGVDEAAGGGRGRSATRSGSRLPMGGYDGRSQVRIAGTDAGVAAAVSRAGRRPTAGRCCSSRRSSSRPSCRWSAHGDRTGADARVPRGAQRPRRGDPRRERRRRRPIDPVVADDAAEIADSIARGLDIVGVLTVELFQLRGGGLMVNELAPRVHNSGHWTIEGAATSQFEQHVRAICGLPLGLPDRTASAAMVNLLGTGSDRPARLLGLERALDDPDAHVHVYDKRRCSSDARWGTSRRRPSDDGRGASAGCGAGRRRSAMARWTIAASRRGSGRRWAA